jgi:heme-degrading monooxygenase HmoA
MEIITRIWHGKIKSKDAETYLQYVIDTGVKEYLYTPGNLGVQILKRNEGEITHIWTVTRWDSIESIKKFAGEDYEKAKYYPEDKKYLIEFEPNVIHCETFEFSN